MLTYSFEMSGKEFGENWKFKMAARGSFSKMVAKK
jgi:hypothetical protein